MSDTPRLDVSDLTEAVLAYHHSGDRALARKARMSHTTIFRARTGHTPNLKTMLRLLRALGGQLFVVLPNREVHQLVDGEHERELALEAQGPPTVAELEAQDG